MSKSLFIAEKPSVAQQFGAALGENLSRRDGYLEGEHMLITWCVGHLVTMSYPDVYDEKYKKWRLETLPFLPTEFKYEVISSSAKQYGIVTSLMKRDDVDTIYVCTDSGREGEYIYRLVEQMSGVTGKVRKRVWIDSQTEEEILRGVKEAKDLSEYDNLSDAAYLRAKEDYLMGINFSRLLSIRYGNSMANFLNEKYCVVSVGRVMTCVLGMIVRREREIRNFEKTPFYRVLAGVDVAGANLSMEWKAVVGSRYENSPLLYKENGFKEMASAVKLIEETLEMEPGSAVLDEERRILGQAKGSIEKIEKKKEKKKPPLLYNLAELQNDCSKFFKISPDETLAVVQELYEKKLVTYPRTDARVLSTAVAKEIHKNIRGLLGIPGVRDYAQTILDQEMYKGLAKTRYVNDKQITDHYAIIPTGQGLSALKGLNSRAVYIYETIVRRFLAIFYPPAEYEKLNLTIKSGSEYFFASEKYLKEPGYLSLMEYSFRKKKTATADAKEAAAVDNGSEENEGEEDENLNINMAEVLAQIKKGDEVITVACGFPTTVTPALQYGAVPVFVDVTVPQYNIDVTKLEAALSPKTKAVMIAHTLGNPFDLSAVKAFCDAHNLWLVEDNCDALGTQYTINGETRFTGTWGDIGTSSFYPPHHMTMGEGGCVYTNNPLLNRLILSFRDWGRDCICPSGQDNFCGHRFDGQFGELPKGYDHKYVYSHFGYNLKVTDMQAAIGCEQLKKFPTFIERRRHNWDRLRAALEPAADKLILPEPAANSRPSWFGFLISVKPESGLDRNAVTRYVESHNVQTRLLFSGNLIKHPCFDEMRAEGKGYRVVGDLTNTDRIMRDTFWVGVYPGMNDEMIDYMAKTIREALDEQ